MSNLAFSVRPFKVEPVSVAFANPPDEVWAKVSPDNVVETFDIEGARKAAADPAFGLPGPARAIAQPIVHAYDEGVKRGAAGG